MNISYSDYGVTYPKGFFAASYAAGLKPDRLDMALIYSEVPAVCALVTTSNKVKAAPVLWDRAITADGSLKRAAVINVGSANACTGEQGLENARTTAARAAQALSLQEKDVIVSSTGVIGVQLEMEKMLPAVDAMAANLSRTEKAGKDVAHAILTTDTVIKTASAEFEIAGKTVRIGAMAKGSGMIRPNMATMLSYACTDCAVTQPVLQQALSKIAEDTYNMISVDGDMSTNDTAVVLANGMAENPVIDSLDSAEGQVFYQALFEVEKRLANAIVRDGEGATRFIEVRVSGARTDQDARALARSVVESSLVKAAVFGRDANWGRVLCALGYAEADFDPERVQLVFSSPAGEMTLFKEGRPVAFDEAQALEILSADAVAIDVLMNLGASQATAWGCDLSYEYVTINAEYRS